MRKVEYPNTHLLYVVHMTLEMKSRDPHPLVQKVEQHPTKVYQGLGTSCIGQMPKRSRTFKRKG